MFFIFFIIALCVGAFIITTFEDWAKEWHREDACAYYIQLVHSGGTPTEQIKTLNVPPAVLEYTREYIPLLYSQWEQIRKDYASIQKSIASSEAIYQKLIELNELNKDKINSERPLSYQTWLDKQQKELAKLQKAHEQILQPIEKYYAEAQLRGVTSDKDMQESIAHIINSTNMVLNNHGYENPQASTKPKEKEQNQGAKKTKKRN